MLSRIFDLLAMANSKKKPKPHPVPWPDPSKKRIGHATNNSQVLKALDYMNPKGE
jgi:hypothetical protein